VERSDEVARQFEGLKLVRRSQLPSATTADILLVDSTGELRDWYRLATVVFVGKSLPGVAEAGGQNPGEPAALGLPVVFGPHMENFASLVEHLLARDAAVSVNDGGSLAGAIGTLLKDTDRRAALGARAKEAVTAHQGASERTAAALAELQKN
jgi:3-deoxy-D-manno-octulosonic-acid transferase